MPAHHGRGVWGREPDSLCCDVLDAWFDPSPRVKEAANRALDFIGVSPDTDCHDLRTAISEVRGVDFDAISFGAGSSEIIHRVLPKLIGSGRVLLLDPTYSEYEHVLRNCDIQRIALQRDNDWNVSLDLLIEAASNVDSVVIVNPNNPTGKLIPANSILELRKHMPSQSNLWIDEAYIDYSQCGSSLEKHACELRGIYVLKSMSKAYALSGLRAAYLVCHPEAAALERDRTPPWIIGTVAQLAAEAATRDKAYYIPLWLETIALARELATSLRGLGLHVTTGDLNAVLVECNGSAAQWAAALAEHGLFVRTTLGMGAALGDDYIRISVVRREEISGLTAKVLALQIARNF